MKKKIIKINNNKFVHKINSMNLITCDHVKDAMDISEIPFEILRDVLGRLHSLGHTKSTIVEVKK